MFWKKKTQMYFLRITHDYMNIMHDTLYTLYQVGA